MGVVVQGSACRSCSQYFMIHELAIDDRGRRLPVCKACAASRQRLEAMNINLPDAVDRASVVAALELMGLNLDGLESVFIDLYTIRVELSSPRLGAEIPING